MSRHYEGDVSLNPVYLSARSAIVMPERAIPVTIYALNKWLPRLGTERWSLVQFLRGLCFDAPRRPDGTKRVTTSWKFLAECLQVHEETIASWLKHESIPDDKPWRRIKQTDDYSEYLSYFIPRLRYAYETHKGKTRRVGFLLEVLMEDPIAPEDEVKLSQQVALLNYQQTQLGLEARQTPQNLKSRQTNLPQLSETDINNVTSSDADLPTSGHSDRERLTSQDVNRNNPDLLPPVKQYYVDSSLDVTTNTSDSHYGKSDVTADNVNKLNLLIEQLKSLKHQKRNYLQILEPVVVLTERLLEDYHSTAMLYKVLKILFPDYTDIYVSAVEEALVAHAVEDSLNKGAIFVRTVRQLADEVGIDLGFRQSEETPIERSLERGALAPPMMTAPLSTTPELSTSLEDAIWSETLSMLRGRMPKGTFNSVMQGTQLLGLEDDTYIVRVATKHAKAWLDNRLKKVVERALSTVIGTTVKVDFRL